MYEKDAAWEFGMCEHKEGREAEQRVIFQGHFQGGECRRKMFQTELIGHKLHRYVVNTCEEYEIELKWDGSILHSELAAVRSTRVFPC